MKKRSVKIAGHPTSITMEDEFWNEFKAIARARNQSLNTLITEIDKTNSENLSSAIRVFVLQTLKSTIETYD